MLTIGYLLPQALNRVLIVEYLCKEAKKISTLQMSFLVQYLVPTKQDLKESCASNCVLPAWCLYEVWQH